MSDERRWRLSGQIIKAGPHVNSSQPVDVMPVAEHEAALARVERERERLALGLRRVLDARLTDVASRDVSVIAYARGQAMEAMIRHAEEALAGEDPGPWVSMQVFTRVLGERDALRAQVKALTGERAVEAAARVIEGPAPCWCPDDWRQPYDQRRCPLHGEAPWPPLRKATAALAAARDAAAAKAPDQPAS